MPTTVRVLIADDHPSTRAGVRLALEAAGFEICAEVDSAPAAQEAATAEQPDVCLLDVHMPGSGIEAAEIITRKLPDTAVVMLTVSDADEDLFAALRAGASGYLLKDMDPDRLPSALHGILAGEAAIPRALVSRVVEEFRGTGQRRLALATGRTVQLSSREWEVLEMLDEGLTTAQIGQRLFISPVTVRRHISGLLAKLRVENREQAVQLLRDRRSS
jgi:DNA-binding NarL/FixJ family response regulator